jgi:hypothetical protein
MWRENTYDFPMTLSKNGLDHQVVEEICLKEINLLQEGKPLLMYSRSHQKTVNGHADIYCVMKDQPERRSNLRLGNSNSSTHARSGYLIDIKQVQLAGKVM